MNMTNMYLFHMTNVTDIALYPASFTQFFNIENRVKEVGYEAMTDMGFY